MKSAVASDIHVLPGALDLCDYALVRAFVEGCIVRRVDEVILAGDIIDATRGGNRILLPAASLLWEHVGRPLIVEAGIDLVYELGNHDYLDGDLHALTQALFAAGFPGGGKFVVTTGPLMRGNWIIVHGNNFDPWCKTPANVLTRVGEIATAIDHAADSIGIDIEPLNPTNWDRAPDLVAPLDLATHRTANRWACANHASLIFGHSHSPYRLDGDDWRVRNTGSLARGSRLSYVVVDDVADTADLVRA